MMTTTAVDETRRALANLTADRDHYRTLAGERDATLDHLRRTRADLGELASTTAERDAARAAWQRLDREISAARGELERLEAEAAHERDLDELRALARQATEHREALGVAVTEGSAALEAILDTMHAHLEGWTQARAAFVAKAQTLAPGIAKPDQLDMTPPMAVRAADDLLSALRHRPGQTFVTKLAAVLDGAAGKPRTRFDENPRLALPGSDAPMAPELYGALRTTRDSAPINAVYIPRRPER
jgi:hypothetical protein